MSVLFSFVEQLCSHCTDSHQILHYNIFQRSVDKIHITLKSHNNNQFFTWRQMYVCDNRYFTWRQMYIWDNISPNCS